MNSIAVIGCGAIAESYYFPALAAKPEWRAQVWLIEPVEARRRAFASTYGFDPSQQAATVADMPALPTVAINCTPSHLHVATSLPLLSQGVSMIVEKPLAETSTDARRLIEAAEGRALLSVNHQRRLGGSNQLVFDILRSGKLGQIRRIGWTEGRKFEWPTQSGFNFRRPWDGRPRGAILDVGVHIIDLVSWWLGERLTVRSATLDGYGGPECFADLKLASSTAAIEIVLSFHNKLANTFEIVGENGVLTGSVQDFDWIDIQYAGRPRQTHRLGPAANRNFADRLIGAFLDAVEKDGGPPIDAHSVIPALEVIDEIYASAADPLPACYSEWAA